MGEALQLRGNGGLNPGVAVAGIQNRDATAEIDEAAALDVPELSVFGVINEEVGHHGDTPWRHRQAPLMPVGIRGTVLGFQDGVHVVVSKRQTINRAPLGSRY
jgi:hypothetical protein